METEKKKPKPKPTPTNPDVKRAWVLGSNGKVTCYASSEDKCNVLSLWEAAELTSFHDADLAKATEEINEILGRVESNNEDPERMLTSIEFQGRHFLVWAHCGGIGPHEDEATIVYSLKLKLE